MMIKKNNVHFWLLTDDKLLYTDDVNKQFCVEILNTGTSGKHNLSYSPTFFYHIPENRLVIVDDVYQPSSIYAGSDLHPVNMSEVGGILVQDQNPRFMVFFDDKIIEEQIYKVFDWIGKKVIVESKRPFTIVKDKALTIIDGVLTCYTLNGEPGWLYKPAPADPQLDQEFPTKIIGIYKNELWIQPDKNSFIVLDAVTGKPIFPHFNVKEILGTSLSIGEAYIDETSGKIKILAYWYYIEIDLATYTAEIKKKHDDNWSIGVGRFYDGDVSVYFTADYPLHGKTIGNITAGIFNTGTLEIEWYYSLSGEDKHQFFVGQPQANDKYVGVKDSNDTLYLFER